MTRTLWAASYKHLLLHPAQLILALVGLTVGVATITAVDLATAGARRAFSLSIDAVNGTTTHQIVAGPGGVPESLFVELARAPEAPAVSPIVEGYVSIGDRSFDLLGIDPFADQGRAGTGLSAGDESVSTSPGAAGATASTLDLLRKLLTEPGAIILEPSVAAAAGVVKDATVLLDIGGRQREARLAGLSGANQPGLQTIILTDIAQAQEWFEMPGRLSRIDVHAAGGASGERQIRWLQGRLPASVQLIETPRAARENLDMTSAFMTNLRAMSLLALLVSLFLIYSAMSFAVVQRRSTLATMRALGVTRAEILRMILCEAAVLGAAGAVAGAFAGRLLGHGLLVLVSRTVNDLYFVTAIGEVRASALDLAVALFAGVGAAVVAALVPAVEASSGAPIPAMRRSALERKAQSLARWLIGVSAALAASSFAIVLISDRSVYAGFAALLLLLLAVAACTPAALQALSRLAANVLRGRRPVAHLAIQTVGASLSRTGVAIAALAVAVAAMLGVSIMVGSFRESLADWLGHTLSADLYISAPGPGFGRPERRLDPEVVRDFFALPEVIDHAATRRVSVQSDKGTLALEALELARPAHRGVDLLTSNTEAVWQAFGTGAVIISQPLSYRLKLHEGDSLMLSTDQGPHRFSIAGIYRDYGNDRGNVLIARAHYRHWWKDDALSALGLYLAPTANSAQVEAKLRALAAGRQTLFIRSNADLRTLSLQIFDRTFVITRVLEWLAAGVAVIGLLSALLAWELERSRELAVLRAVGLTPRDTAAMITIQTAFMGLCALIAALPAGLLTAIVLIEAINQRAFGWQIDLHIHAGQFSGAAVLALGAALAAAVYPAWRAARMNVSAGMREE